MKVLGIVVEYNPFHNGHIYHIEQSKAATGSDAVVCVMSGNFIQRGEPALINKFARAEIALNNGVDLVIELPHTFAMSSAESFAFGAVKILDSIGIVDCIAFGSEHGNVDSLNLLADILVNEPEEYRTELKKNLDKGLAFPVCRQKALKKYLEITFFSRNEFTSTSEIMQIKADPSDLSELLETSNNILGIEYLKALKRLKSSIVPHTITRVSNKYNTSDLTGSISSATAIRNSIFKSLFAETEKLNNSDYLCNELRTVDYELPENTVQTLPEYSKLILKKEFSLGRGPVGLKQYEAIIFALLRKLKPEQLRELPDVSEGLEYRIKSAGENSGTIEELIENISTKRYAQTRIQRILFSLLTGTTKADTDMFMYYGGPQYARILGFNQTGRQLLSKMKKSSTLPVITKASDFKTSCNHLLARMLEIEALSTDIYVLGYKNPAFRKAGQEFTQNRIIIS
ncbi:MAG: hypothetical protein K0R50_1806 [Eubacterium sp.]|nr:hypothetical protein [Eubacterium sp.]